MLKSVVFHFLADGDDSSDKFCGDMTKHDKQLNDFIESISTEGHTFVSINQVAYGRFDKPNRIRTIVIYFENLTRKVLIEITDKKND